MPNPIAIAMAALRRDFMDTSRTIAFVARLRPQHRGLASHRGQVRAPNDRLRETHTDLILRSIAVGLLPTAMRLEGWRQVRSLWPSFETVACKRMRPPQDEGRRMHQATIALKTKPPPGCPG